MSTVGAAQSYLAARTLVAETDVNQLILSMIDNILNLQAHVATLRDELRNLESARKLTEYVALNALAGRMELMDMLPENVIAEKDGEIIFEGKLNEALEIAIGDREVILRAQ